MNIFVDESGSFVDAPKAGSWNSVAAYMSPESDRKHVRRLLSSLKRSVGAAAASEIKLKHVPEKQYFRFLQGLSKLSGALYAVATDSGLNQAAAVATHQAVQTAKVVEHKDKMIHQSGRDGVQALSDRIGALAPQLYVQMHCQVNLIEAILHSGVLYFVQRKPRSLGAFRWRIDQKNSTKTEYETAFQQVLPAFLQSISIRDPMPMLIEADYSSFNRFNWAPDEKPTYLKDTYGIEVMEEESALNVGMVVRENLQFVDSKSNPGVQIADLLASGIRRCLRYEFTDNETAASLLGQIMVQNYKGKLPMQLLGFSEAQPVVDENAGQMVKIMERKARAMLAR